MRVGKQRLWGLNYWQSISNRAIGTFTCTFLPWPFASRRISKEHHENVARSDLTPQCVHSTQPTKASTMPLETQRTPQQHSQTTTQLRFHSSQRSPSPHVSDIGSNKAGKISPSLFYRFYVTTNQARYPSMKRPLSRSLLRLSEPTK